MMPRDGWGHKTQATTLSEAVPEIDYTTEQGSIRAAEPSLIYGRTVAVVAQQSTIALWQLWLNNL